MRESYSVLLQQAPLIVQHEKPLQLPLHFLGSTLGLASRLIESALGLTLELLRLTLSLALELLGLALGLARGHVLRSFLGLGCERMPSAFVAFPCKWARGVQGGGKPEATRRITGLNHVPAASRPGTRILSLTARSAFLRPSLAASVGVFLAGEVVENGAARAVREAVVVVVLDAVARATREAGVAMRRKRSVRKDILTEIDELFLQGG